MDALEILNANWKAEDGSFLYYFHEENNFHEAAFLELCGCISSYPGFVHVIRQFPLKSSLFMGKC